MKIADIRAFPTSFPVPPEARVSLGIGTAVKRDAVVVATKGGFLPFDGPAPKGLLGPGDLVAGTHCMSPRYLEDQLERSLANLGLGGACVHCDEPLLLTELLGHGGATLLD